MKLLLNLFNLKNSIWYVVICCAACGQAQQHSEPPIATELSEKKDSSSETTIDEVRSASIDTALYNKKILSLAHDSSNGMWPVQAPYPLPGAILPFKRVVAFYGNFYSKGMGILGELPEDQLITKLNNVVKNWEAADTATPVLPAIHYIAVTAQASAGRDGKYRLRMPSAQIDTAIDLAKKVKGIVFVDVQVGLSSLEQELPLLETYLLMPGVHLGIDPEFSMKDGSKPGSKVGTFDAADINYASGYLASLVKKYGLPPKILVVHRFTQGMVTNYKAIITRPEVQLVMDMDGFGFPAKKINTYQTRITVEPVQFTGFKLFFKNDLVQPKWNQLMQPEEVLSLYPKPVYIQYQ